MAEEIICLGKKFNSEDERREYFRNELRKKLPELKKIEGFPIGEDEDIIALSDPPYYTACPNPWINDFILFWEQEKQGNNLRITDFNVNKPYASDISEGKYDPFYRMHPYHTKVPHLAIMRYILHYTQPGDIIFDGFAGTGMTGVACKLCENPDLASKYKIEKEFNDQGFVKPIWGSRNPILGDISSMSSFIAYIYNNPIKNQELFDEISNLLAEVRTECNEVFLTKHKNGENGYIISTYWSDVFLCNSCNREIIFWETAVDRDKGIVLDSFHCPHCQAILTKKEINPALYTVRDPSLDKTISTIKRVPVIINYQYNGRNYSKTPDSYDFKQIDIIDNQKISYWHPVMRMCDGSESRRNDKYGITHVHQFYFKRNLIVLAKLFDLCKKPYLLQFLTAVAFRITKRYGLTFQSGTWGAGGGPTSGTLYVPSLIKDLNILDMIDQAIAKRMKVNNSAFKAAPIYTQSSTILDIKDSSIDYIFLDPPFGSNLNYSELNFIWESWLKVYTNIKEEAIENKTQNKGLLEYKDLLLKCLKEAYRILKPNKWMTVEFSNTKASVWNVVQTSLSEAGFIIANVSALDKQKGSFVSITTPTAVKQDLVISCYKPSLKFQSTFNTFDSVNTIWEFINEHLNHLPIHIIIEGSTTSIIERSPKILYDRLITFLLLSGHSIPIDAKVFQEGLRQRFIEKDGMYFTQEQAVAYELKKAKTSNFIQTSWQVATEGEGVEWLKRELRSNSLKYQDIHPKWMQAITAVRKGDILPELRDILQQNFIEESDGSWRVPDMNESKDREIIRNKALLKEFNNYVEFAKNPKSKRMKEVRVEALRAGFKQCWGTKDFRTIVKISDKIPQNLLLEDEQLLMYYDIAKDRV